MTRRDLLTMGACAAATFGLSLALFLPRNLNAVDEAQKVSAKIGLPTLTVNGCELSILGGENLKSGLKPTFKLVALNKADESTSVSVTIQATVTTPSSPMSRRLPTPTVLWQESRTIALGPGERAEIPIEMTKELPAAGYVSVNLIAEKQSISAMRFSLGELKLGGLQAKSVR